MYKWINKDKAGRLINKDYEYKLGKLHVMGKFNTSKKCTTNAFYCCAAKDIHEWSDYGNALFEVELPEGTQVIDLCDKYKVDRLLIVRKLEWAEILELNPYILHQVPVKLITPERCLAAMQQNYWAFQYVPDHLKTQEMCLAAVRQEAQTLRRVPDHLKTQEMCTMAVSKCGINLDYVPLELRTYDLCAMAVLQSSSAFKYVPDHLRA